MALLYKYIFLAFILMGCTQLHPWSIRSKSTKTKKIKTSKSSKRRKSRNAIETVSSASFQTDEDRLLLEKKNNFIIRVLLANNKQGEQPLLLTCDRGVTITEWDSSNRPRKKEYAQKQLRLSYSNGSIALNGMKIMSKKIYINPQMGHIEYNGARYQGGFLVCVLEEKILLINCLDLEDYICSVLHTESWPGWPLEINKVLAIACRTYAMATALSAKKNKQLYHLTNTNLHQTYKGMHNNAAVKQAVHETRGVFVAHNKEPILAMFDVCCGGVRTEHIADFNFVQVPYLARKNICKYCKRCNKVYSWKAEYSIKDVESALKISRLRDIKISKKDKAGLVAEVTVRYNKNNSLVLSGKKVYSLFKKIKSFCFSIAKKGNTVVFDGRGYGHHIGLCQWGAREMVRDGWDYKRVLQFTYPGTQFMCLRQ